MTDLAPRVADAYVWGLPLVIMHRTCAAHGGVGRGLVRRATLATAADRTVVAPNNDTLYASGWFDLRAGDLTVDVGPMDAPGRYWSVMLLDAHTHVQYLCRRLHGTGGLTARVTLDPTGATEAMPAGEPAAVPAGSRVPAPAPAAGAAPAGAPDAVPAGSRVPAPAPAAGAAPAGAPDVVPAGSKVPGAPAGGVREGTEVVRIGTPTVWVLARVLVEGPDDLPAARALLDSITVDQAPSRRGLAHTVAAGGPAGTAASREGGFLGELARAVAVDPPAAGHPAAPDGLDELLAMDLPAGVVADGIARGKARVAAGRGVDRRGNGWGTRSRGADFGDDVDYRASFARVSLAGHRPAENRSYTRPFDGSAPGLLRFPPGGEPPVGGFWSLCVYGPDLFLVDNPIDRYSVGDRTPGLRRDADGGLTIHVGHERPAEGANWLPAPDGPCFLTLRAYEGGPGVVAATWFPPDIVPEGAR